LRQMTAALSLNNKKNFHLYIYNLVIYDL